jgi:hypothetical protein
VARRTPTKEPVEAASEARGRSDSAAELKNRLASAPPPYVLGALDNPNLGPDEMFLLLRNRSAPAAALSRVARDREWTRLREVKRALVRHPNTPTAMARALAPHLHDKDLGEVAEDVRVRPSVRRRAEEILKIRIEAMPLGERISLARRPSHALAVALAECADAGVLRALLGNPRLLEADAVRIASGARTPPEALRAIAEHVTWGARRSVRMALLLNPRTPVPVALRLVRAAMRHDLSRLAADAKAPRIVRVGAERRLEESPGG